MKAAAAALCFEVDMIPRPSGDPIVPPGPVSPGSSISAALPTILDDVGSFDTTSSSGPLVRLTAALPEVKDVYPTLRVPVDVKYGNDSEFTVAAGVPMGANGIGAGGRAGSVEERATHRRRHEIPGARGALGG